MKLFCAKCKVFFDNKDKVYKVQVDDRDVPFRFYHKRCLPGGANFILECNTADMIDSLEHHKLTFTCKCVICGELFESKHEFAKYCKKKNCYYQSRKERQKENLRNWRAKQKMLMASGG